MLAIVVAPEGEPSWRRTYAATDIYIGRAPSNQLALEGKRVAKVHARVYMRGGELILANVSKHQPTFVDGARLSTHTTITPVSRIMIGRYHLTVGRHVPQELGTVQIRDATEQRLIDEVVAGDDASRLVYADWLEARGDTNRAEYLRLQQQLAPLPADDPAFSIVSARIAALAMEIDLAWRSRVSHAPVEGCKFDVACPKEWSAMAPTGDEGVRHCSSCNENVHYCASVEDARAHAAERHCVAIDVTSPRWSGDLEPPFGDRVCVPCGIDVGHGLDQCPRCGHSFVRQLRRGMIMLAD